MKNITLVIIISSDLIVSLSFNVNSFGLLLEENTQNKTQVINIKEKPKVLKKMSK